MPSNRVDVQLDINAGETARELRERTPRQPHRVLVIGEFSGPQRARGSVDTVRPVRVDRDSLDDTIASLRPTVSVDLSSGRQVTIDFSSLEDFHPDSLYTRVPVFRELRSDAMVASAEPRLTSPASRGGSVLDAILADSQPPASGASLDRTSLEATHGSEDSLDEFVRRAVAPHQVSAPTAAERSVSLRGDAAVAAALREVIHHADYRAVEALWRGVHFLTRRLDTDAELQLWLLDVSFDDISRSLPLDATFGARFSKSLITMSGGDSSNSAWSMTVVPRDFDDTVEDLRLLDFFGRVSASVGATLLAGASPGLLGADSSSAFDEADSWHETSALWTELRRSHVARHIGLTAPRLLARLPYGVEGDPCEVVSFEEVGSDNVELCWQSGAFAAALIAADALQRNDSFARYARDIEDLPQYLYERDGEFFATPCAEVLLSERSIETMLEKGVMPLVSQKDGDLVRLPRLQSIASPLTPLAPWALA